MAETGASVAETGRLEDVFVTKRCHWSARKEAEDVVVLE